MADLVAGDTLATGDEENADQGQAGDALAKLATGRVAGSRSTGRPGRRITTPAHASVRSQRERTVPAKARPLFRSGCVQANQVVFSQLAAAVDSLCDVPGLGQLGGAVMSRIGIVMIEFGSQTGNSYLGSFLVIPITASL